MNVNDCMKKGMVLSLFVVLLGASVASGLHEIESDAKNIDQQQIGINAAIQVAHNKLRQLEKSNDFSIQESHELRSNDGILLCYIFELQPQGYIVVSACTDLPPVIAYSFTDGYSVTNDEENILLQLLETDLEYRYESISNLPDELLEERRGEWDALLVGGSTIIGAREFQQWPPEGSTSTGGWLETNWHQSAPYNNFCPIDLSSGQRSVAGCPAVAMAQILNYHETIQDTVFDDSDDYYHNYAGNRYWIDDDYVTYDFPSFPQLNSYLDTLVYHYENGITLTNNDKAALTFACGVAAQQVYNPGGSGTFSVNQAYQAYLRFSFDDIELLDETDPDIYNRLSANMMDALPAHLAVVNPSWTAGHNVVVDGYNTDDYYHLNFGWGGPYNGWYLLPDEIPYDLTVIEGLIVDIIPDYTVDPDQSYVNLTGGVGMHPSLQSEYATWYPFTVTVIDTVGQPIEGIPADNFSFTATLGTDTFSHCDLNSHLEWNPFDAQTDSNGEMQWRVRSSTSVGADTMDPTPNGGYISITASVLGVNLNDSDDLPVSSCDIDIDGDVDLSDFSRFAVDFGLNRQRSDFDYSGSVTLSDFSTFAVEFGSGQIC